MPRKNKPRRVDLYYSSWCIRAGIGLHIMNFSFNLLFFFCAVRKFETCIFPRREIWFWFWFWFGTKHKEKREYLTLPLDGFPRDIMDYLCFSIYTPIDNLYVLHFKQLNQGKGMVS